MAEAITGLFKFAFSFIRTKTAEKLQDGGLADQKFRGWILRELDDIKLKLDASARKDLCASISFLQQGIQRLSISVGESSESGDRDGSPSTSDLDGAVRNSSETKPVPQSVTVKDAVALANIITKLKIESSERFDLAKKSFQDAGKQATLAFHNAALSTEERILASKVRFASGILEHLEDPKMAACDCLQYLKELHDMATIKEIFSVYTQGGVKSVIKKDSRKEIVEIVTMINLILADFISNFTKQRMAVFDWPTIVCGKRVVHPIHFKSEKFPNLSEMKITLPWDIVELEDNQLRDNCALNKKGELVCFTKGEHGPQKLVKTTGKLQPYCLSTFEDKTEDPESDNDIILGLAFDEDDTMYVVSCGKDAGHRLSIYSADGRNTHQSTLKFDISEYMNIGITHNKNIVILRNPFHPNVCVCDRNGELLYSFDVKEHDNSEDSFVKSMAISSNDEIVLVIEDEGIFRYSYHLSTYTQDGKFRRTVKFRTMPFLGYEYKSTFYNNVTKTIIGYGAKTFMQDVNDETILSIEYLSETGKKSSCLLYPTNLPQEVLDFRLVCHTNGAMALVGDRQVIYLQNPSPST